MPKPTSFKLLVLRAGPSAWESDGRIVGASDLPMTDEGRDEIAREIDEMPDDGLSVILSAGDEASQQTAKLLRNGTGVKVKTVRGLGEVGLGLWEGVLGADLEERFPTIYKQWLDDPSSVRAPEGEAFSDAQDRVLTELAKALEKTKGETPSIGVVVRPLVAGIIRSFLDGKAANELWDVALQRVSRSELTREALLGILERSGAKAS